LALDFNGSSHFIQAGYTPITGHPLTMACWMNPDTEHTGCPMGIGSTTEGDAIVLVTLSPGNNVHFISAESSGGFAEAIGSAASTQGVWQHLCGVLTSASDRTVYLNGGNSGNDTTSVTPTSLNRVRIGGAGVDVGGDTFFDGKVAEAAIWNVALTSAEVAMLALGFSPALIRPTALRFYAPLIREGAINLHGAAMTVSGPTVSEHPRIMYSASSRITTAAASSSAAFQRMIGARFRLVGAGGGLIA
jgi:hypothetical protein